MAYWFVPFAVTLWWSHMQQTMELPERELRQILSFYREKHSHRSPIRHSSHSFASFLKCSSINILQHFVQFNWHALLVPRHQLSFSLSLPTLVHSVEQHSNLDDNLDLFSWLAVCCSNSEYVQCSSDALQRAVWRNRSYQWKSASDRHITSCWTQGLCTKPALKWKLVYTVVWNCKQAYFFKNYITENVW